MILTKKVLRNYLLIPLLEFREYLDLVEISAVHDSINCMKILYNIFKEELDDEDIIEYLKGICEKYGSDSVIKFLNERNLGEFDMDKFNDRSIVSYFNFSLYFILFFSYLIYFTVYII